MIFNPLEQFELVLLGNYYLKLTNINIYVIVVYFFGCMLFYKLVKFINFTNFFDTGVKIVIFPVYAIIKQILAVETVSYRLYILFIFLFLNIVCLNLCGLVIFSFSVTSHFLVTFYFGWMFLGVLYIWLCFNERWFFFLRFLPHKMSFLLNLLLIPLELLSFIARLVSLTVRLFANILAGHLLLKIFIMFIFLIFSLVNNFLFSFFGINLICLLICFIFLLEFCVCFLQGYVFLILVLIYFGEFFNPMSSGGSNIH